jgi:hypothetical protein
MIPASSSGMLLLPVLLQETHIIMEFCDKGSLQVLTVTCKSSPAAAAGALPHMQLAAAAVAAPDGVLSPCQSNCQLSPSLQ